MALKSFSIKIGADTKDFNKGLKDADKAIKSTVKEGKSLKEALKLEYSTKGFEATQKTYQHAINLTEQKVQALREQLKYLEDSGAVDTDNYYELQTKLAKAQIEAKNLKKELEGLKNVRIEELTEKINKVGSGLTNAGKGIGAFSAAAGAALVGGYALASNARKAGDEISNLSNQYDLSTKSIQKWNYIALQTGLSSDNLYKSIQKTRETLGDIAAGETNSATAAIESLMGSVNNVSKDTETAFNQIVNALSKVNDSTLQSYYANEIFGNSLGSHILPMIKSGSGAISELSKEFEDVGYLTTSEVNTLSKLNNQMNKVETELDNAKLRLGVALIPIMEKVIDLLNTYIIPTLESLASWFEKLPSGMQNIIITATGLLAIASPLLLIGGKLVSTIGSMVGALPKLATVVGKLNTPLGKTATILTTIAIIAKMITDIASVWTDMSIGQKIAAVLGVVSFALGALAIMAGAANSALTFGVAAAAIVGGIIAVTAAVNSAKNDAGVQGGDYAVPDISGNSKSTSYDVPKYNSSTSNSSYTDNSRVSNDTYNITVESNEYVSEDQLLDVLTKKLAIKIQSRR